jgi:SAM-dependent methyltransferase
MDLAQRAGVGAGMSGVDLCCCNGAGMRFLVRFRNVAHMQGVDATLTVVEKGKHRCAEEGLAQRIDFKLADVCDTGLPAASYDFVWGEDAWCYVVDKSKLVREAARLVKSQGVVAFTDWIEGPVGLTDAEAERFLRFMKFPNLMNLQDYTKLLTAAGCEILTAEDTGRYSPCIDLYLEMLEKQLTYDALRILNFDLPVMEGLGAEMKFAQQLAHANKIIQGIFVARKK